MPKPIKFRNRGESQHWSRVQAATINRYSWPNKSKTRPEMVVTLAGFADWQHWACLLPVAIASAALYAVRG